MISDLYRNGSAEPKFGGQFLKTQFVYLLLNVIEKFLSYNYIYKCSQIKQKAKKGGALVPRIRYCECDQTHLQPIKSITASDQYLQCMKPYGDLPEAEVRH